MNDNISELSVVFSIVSGYIRDIKSTSLPVDVIKTIIPYYALSVQKERELIQNIGYKWLIEGDIWYAISKKWWNIFTKYTCLTDDDLILGIDSIDTIHTLGYPRPSRIDNSDLQGIYIYMQYIIILNLYIYETHQLFVVCIIQMIMILMH